MIGETAGYTNKAGDTLQVATNGPGMPVKFTVIRTKRFLGFKWTVREAVLVPWGHISAIYRRLDPVRAREPTTQSAGEGR